MVMKPPQGSGPPRASQPTFEDPPVEKTVVMPGAPKTGRPAPPPADSARALPGVPPATPSDRVLLPSGPDSEKSGAAATVTMPGWVMFYVFVALAVAAVGACVLFVESRIVGHF